MKRIGLIGAPGAQKTQLARRLSRELSDPQFESDCDCGERGIQLVDDYVNEIQKESNIYIGPTSGYLGNLYVALGRYARERLAMQKNCQTVITCGTLLETAVYQALNIIALNELQTEEDREASQLQITAQLGIMSCLYTDIFVYEHLFYLPPVNADEDVRNFDKQLQTAVHAFKLGNVVSLPIEGLEERVAAVLAAVRP